MTGASSSCSIVPGHGAPWSLCCLGLAVSPSSMQRRLHQVQAGMTNPQGGFTS